MGEVGLEAMRLKSCHANVGFLVLLIRALASFFAWSINGILLSLNWER